MQDFELPDDADRLLEMAEREKKRRIAQRSPADFAEYASDGHWKPFAHLQLLNHHLMRAARGEAKRLIVMMPPQHGKSTLTSEYFPAWYLGMNPTKRVILASYEAEFARDWGRKVRNILTEHGPEIFDLAIRQDSHASNDWEIDKAGIPPQHTGGMKTAGIGGPVTGKKADLLIIDDPVKNSQEAMSETIQKRNYEWYLSTALTRVSEHGIIVLIQTRWAVEDLAGKLIKDMATKGEQWELVSLPGIALQAETWPTGWTRNAGDPLCPQLFSLETLLKRQRAMSDYLWSALYQQSPLPLGGSMFKAEWFKRWKVYEQQPGYISILDDLYKFDPWKCTRYMTIDSAMTEKEIGEKKADDPDYTVIGVWCALPTPQGPMLLLLSLYRGQMNSPQILEKMRDAKEKWRPAFIAVEAVGGGLALYQFAKSAGLAVKKISKSDADDVFLKIEGEKVVRAMQAQPLMQEGRFFVPEVASWLPEYLMEMLSFPLSAKKDQVDMTAYAVLIAEKYKIGQAYSDGAKSRVDYPENYRRAADDDKPLDVMSRYCGLKPPGVK